jgi:hypothetical protein
LGLPLWAVQKETNRAERALPTDTWGKHPFTLELIFFLILKTGIFLRLKKNRHLTSQVSTLKMLKTGLDHR